MVDASSCSNHSADNDGSAVTASEAPGRPSRVPCRLPHRSSVLVLEPHSYPGEGHNRYKLPPPANRLGTTSLPIPWVIFQWPGRRRAPSMRRCSVSAAAVRSATMAVVLAMMLRPTSCRVVQHQLPRRRHHHHHHDAAAAAIILRRAASFSGRKAGEGRTSGGRCRRRSAPPQEQERSVVAWSARCGFSTPSGPRPVRAAGRPRRPAARTTAVRCRASRAEVGAIAGAGLSADRPRGTLGDREERRLRLERDLQEVAGVAGSAAVVVDPTKTKLGGGRGELEVCRVINGLCQVRKRDRTRPGGEAGPDTWLRIGC